MNSHEMRGTMNPAPSVNSRRPQDAVALSGHGPVHRIAEVANKKAEMALLALNRVVEGLEDLVAESRDELKGIKAYVEKEIKEHLPVDINPT